MVSMEWINQARHTVYRQAVFFNTSMDVTIGRNFWKFLDYFIG